MPKWWRRTKLLPSRCEERDRLRESTFIVHLQEEEEEERVEKMADSEKEDKRQQPDVVICRRVSLVEELPIVRKG
jgi:hypothetical protein